MKKDVIVKGNTNQSALSNVLASVFSYGDRNIRTVVINNEPWFALNDVCGVLSLANTSQVKTRLDKGVISTYPLQTSGGIQETTIINEDGLYDVILDSKKPEAKNFRKWITHEVIPSIRKTGGYNSTTQNYLSMSEEDRAIAYFTSLKEQKEMALLAEQNQPLVTFAETVLKSEDNILVRELSKIIQDKGIDIGQNKLYNKLREWKLIFRNSTEPYQTAMNTGYFVVEEGIYNNQLNNTTKVTPKGQVYIIERLKKEYDIK